jgi:hypothetical protein
MFIRVSRMAIKPGTMDAVMQASEQFVPMTTGLAGLRQYYTVRASDTELLTIGVWDSEENEKAAIGQIHGPLMTIFGPYIEDRPQNWGGEATDLAGR